MNFTSLLPLVCLAVGCANRTAVASRTARELAPPAETPQPSSKVVELRHFYLLTPGPNAKLVVTRSDVGESAQ